MIALAVAALLTTTALAIWAVRVVRRRVDWEGRLHPDPSLPELDAIAADLRRLLARIDRYIAKRDAREAINKATAQHPVTLTVKADDATAWAHAVETVRQAAEALAVWDRPDSYHLNRALRASERDDRRREGQ